jgi:peptidoglycan/LPS O-acetylase OafA/YrhL
VSRPRRARPRVASAAAVIGVAAALAAGYSAAGPAGLADAAALAALGVLILARGLLREETPPVVRAKGRRSLRRRPAVRAADFPAYATIASNLEWAQMSRRHYENVMCPMLARLAATLGRPQALASQASQGNPLDPDGPGVDLATLERIVTRLEGP